jgi:hypothetical protein
MQIRTPEQLGQFAPAASPYIDTHTAEDQDKL